MGFKAQHANTHSIKDEIKDFINNDHRYYVKFAINLPQKIQAKKIFHNFF